MDEGPVSGILDQLSLSGCYFVGIMNSFGDGEKMYDEYIREWVQIDRVIACRDQGSHSTSAQGAVEAQGSSLSKREYLVKWTNIEYNGSTWEEENKDEDMQEAVTKFFERHELAKKKACIKLTDRLVAPTVTEQPKYISGGVLHDYQVQGLQWLLSNYQQRKNVILAGTIPLCFTSPHLFLVEALIAIFNVVSHFSKLLIPSIFTLTVRFAPLVLCFTQLAYQ